jgi:hypothetical protein
MNTALEYSTRLVQEGGRRCKKSTLNDLVHLTPLRIPLMNPPIVFEYSVPQDHKVEIHTKSITVSVPRPNWDPPPPQASVPPDTLACGLGGGEVPIRTTGQKV